MVLNKKAISGFYKPINKHKYKGDVKKIIFRSSYELQFMNYCDLSPTIIEWGSEEIHIPYISPIDNQIHRYFIDFYIKYISNETMLNENNEQIKIVKKAIIEIKPFCETVPPKQPSRLSSSYKTKVATYLINKAKWESACKYAEKYNMEFHLITEKWLRNL